MTQQAQFYFYKHCYLLMLESLNVFNTKHGDLEITGHVNEKRARELKADKALSRCLAFNAQNCVNSKETFKANNHLC